MSDGLTLPQYAYIDLNEFFEKHGLNELANSNHKSELNDYSDDLREAFKIIIKKVLNTIVGDNFKMTEYKNGNATYEYKSKNFYTAIYIKGLRVTYSAQVNTLNFNHINRSVYFDSDFMDFNVKELLIHMLNDFYEFIFIGYNLAYAFEQADDFYGVPSIRRHRKLEYVPFYGVYEVSLLEPKQYRESKDAQKTLEKYF